MHFCFKNELTPQKEGKTFLMTFPQHHVLFQDGDCVRYVFPENSGFSRSDAMGVVCFSRSDAMGEKPLRATVCFSIEHACPRDAYVKTSNDITSA